MKKHITNTPIEFRWECRYSLDEEPDVMGRWARKCFYKDIHIAWVRIIKTSSNIVVFVVHTHFPMNGNDMPHVYNTFKTFEEAKSEVESLWNQFLLKIR